MTKPLGGHTEKRNQLPVKESRLSSRNHTWPPTDCKRLNFGTNSRRDSSQKSPRIQVWRRKAKSRKSFPEFSTRPAARQRQPCNPLMTRPARSEEQLEHVAREAKVAESRLAIAHNVAGKTAWETMDLSGATDPVIEWLEAIEDLLPARVAAERAAAAAAARSASADRRINARRRHPDIADLLNPPTAEGGGSTTKLSIRTMQCRCRSELLTANPDSKGTPDQMRPAIWRCRLPPIISPAIPQEGFRS